MSYDVVGGAPHRPVGASPIRDAEARMKVARMQSIAVCLCLPNSTPPHIDSSSYTSTSSTPCIPHSHRMARSNKENTISRSRNGLAGRKRRPTSRARHANEAAQEKAEATKQKKIAQLRRRALKDLRDETNLAVEQPGDSAEIRQLRGMSSTYFSQAVTCSNIFIQSCTGPRPWRARRRRGCKYRTSSPTRSSGSFYCPSPKHVQGQDQPSAHRIRSCGCEA